MKRIEAYAPSFTTFAMLNDMMHKAEAEGLKRFEDYEVVFKADVCCPGMFEDIMRYAEIGCEVGKKVEDLTKVIGKLDATLVRRWG